MYRGTFLRQQQRPGWRYRLKIIISTLFVSYDRLKCKPLCRRENVQANCLQASQPANCLQASQPTVCKPASQSASQPASQPASLPASQPASQPASHSVWMAIQQSTTTLFTPHMKAMHSTDTDLMIPAGFATFPQ